MTPVLLVPAPRPGSGSPPHWPQPAPAGARSPPSGTRTRPTGSAPPPPTACVEEVVATHGRLDAVVNNAGATHVGTLETDDMDAIRATMEVNFFGVLAVSRAALPHLRASRGRLITVPRVGGVIGQPFIEAYCAAKFAVEGCLESLAPVAARVGVTVAVVEPGAVVSSFIANAGLDPETMIAAAGPYGPALSAYVARVTGQFANAAQTPQDAPAAVVEVLTADHPPFRTQTSDAARQFVAAKLADLDGATVQGHTTARVS